MLIYKSLLAWKLLYERLALFLGMKPSIQKCIHDKGCRA